MHLGEVEFNLIKLPVIIVSLFQAAKTLSTAVLKTQSSRITFLSDKNVIDLKADMMYITVGTQWKASVGGGLWGSH